MSNGLKSALASADAMLHLPTKHAGLIETPAIGAIMGVVFGRLINVTPGLRDLVAGGIPRDALIGALAASSAHVVEAQDADTTQILTRKPDASVLA